MDRTSQSVHLTNYPFTQLTSVEIHPRPSIFASDLGVGVRRVQTGFYTQESAQNKQSPSWKTQRLLLSWRVLCIWKSLCRVWYMWGWEALRMRLPIIAWHKCRICNYHRPKHPSGWKPRTPSASSGECRCLCPGQEGGWETWESRPEYRFGSLPNYVHGKSNRKQVSSSNSHVLLLEAETHSKGRAALSPQKKMCRWK